MLEASVWLIPVVAALHAAAFRLLPWWADAMAWGCVPMLAPPLRGRRQCAVMSLTRGCGRGEATRVALSVHILFLLANPSRNFPLPDQIQRCSQLSCLHADLRPRAPGQQRGGA